MRGLDTIVTEKVDTEMYSGVEETEISAAL